MNEGASTKRSRSDSGDEGPPRQRQKSAKAKVVLDVGGTRFVSARTTLTSGSTYFEALLSQRWHDAVDGGEDEEESSFIDQDPEAFAPLLTYMRSGLVIMPRDNTELCTLTLMQAQFFGVTGFLTTVKATAYKRIHKQTDLMKNEDDDARKFDEKYGTLKAAIASDVLPRCYFRPKETLEIRIHDRVLLAPKKELIAKSSFFQKYLATDPVDYWKNEVVLCGNPDVYEVVLHWFFGRRLHVSSMIEKSMKNVTTEIDSISAKKNFALDVGIAMNYLGMAAVGDEEAVMMSLISRFVTGRFDTGEPPMRHA